MHRRFRYDVFAAYCACYCICDVNYYYFRGIMFPQCWLARQLKNKYL